MVNRKFVGIIKANTRHLSPHMLTVLVYPWSLTFTFSTAKTKPKQTVSWLLYRRQMVVLMSLQMSNKYFQTYFQLYLYNVHRTRQVARHVKDDWKMSNCWSSCKIDINTDKMVFEIHWPIGLMKYGHLSPKIIMTMGWISTPFFSILPIVLGTHPHIRCSLPIAVHSKRPVCSAFVVRLSVTSIPFLTHVTCTFPFQWQVVLCQVSWPAPIQPIMHTKLAVKHQSSSSRSLTFL